MSQPFTTRSEAAKPPRVLVELMARHAYEAGRPKESGRPEWEQTTAEWREAMHREMSAAILAAEGAGYRLSMWIPGTCHRRPAAGGARG